MKRIKLVLIGGGTGLSVLARGLKDFPIDITAIVTVADDGGSTGKIRSEMDIPAPGDIRNVISALSDSETTIERLFQYRFKENQVEGHSLGNLLIAALTNMNDDFGHAVKELSKILNIRGRVIPSTNSSVSLNAVMEDGEMVYGESNIPKMNKKIKINKIKCNHCGDVIVSESVGASLLLEQNHEIGYIIEGDLEGKLYEILEQILINRDILRNWNKNICEMSMNFSFENHVRIVMNECYWRNNCDAE